MACSLLLATSRPLGSGLPLEDWLVIAGYGALVLFIGYRVGRGHQTSSELLLGGRRIPVWAVFCSMVATELSAATFIGVPHAAFQLTGDWTYLQYAFGSLAARAVVATWFLRLYYRLDLVTVYGFLGQRFGRPAELCASWFFMIGRVLGSGCRLFIAALAFATATGFSMETSILLSGSVAAIYTLWGGIRAVIYTDVLQGAVFVIAALASLYYLNDRLPGGLPTAIRSSADLGRTKIFHWPDFLPAGTSASEVWSRFGDVLVHLRHTFVGSDKPFLVAIMGGFFLTLATHGTDQDMVQRLLTTRSSGRGGLALLGSGLANFPLTLVFLLIGTGLFAFYRPDLDGHFQAYVIPPSEYGRIYPIFMFMEMPSYLRGLVFAGLFAAAMSSLDSAINALATTWVNDIRQLRGEGPEVARATSRATIMLSVVLIGAAMAFIPYWTYVKDPKISVVGLALSSLTAIYGGLLGAFLVGLVTKRGTSRSVVCGMIASGLVGIALLLQRSWLDELGLQDVTISWPFWIVIGTSIAFGIGCLPRGDARVRGLA